MNQMKAIHIKFHISKKIIEVEVEKMAYKKILKKGTEWVLQISYTRYISLS